MNLYDPGEAHLRLRDGAAVKLGIETTYPVSGQIVVAVDPAAPCEFSLKLRIPSWCDKPSLRVNGQPADATPASDGYAAIRRTWQKGDKVELGMPLAPRTLLGDHGNQNKVAVLYGPLVLAADASLTGGVDIDAIALSSSDLAALKITAEPAPDALKTWPGAQVFRINAINRKTSAAAPIGLVPFADAGATGTACEVWLPLAAKPAAPWWLGSQAGREPGGVAAVDAGRGRRRRREGLGADLPVRHASAAVRRGDEGGESAGLANYASRNGRRQGADLERPRLPVGRVPARRRTAGRRGRIGQPPLRGNRHDRVRRHDPLRSEDRAQDGQGDAPAAGVGNAAGDEPRRLSALLAGLAGGAPSIRRPCPRRATAASSGRSSGWATSGAAWRGSASPSGTFSMAREPMPSRSSAAASG